jgi:DNA repair exonuclease SbcCD ATPase subunit
VLESGSIFVVTHQDVMKGLFSKQIKVEKVNGETRIAT